MAIPTYMIQLQSSRLITPQVKHFAFTRTDGQLLSFIPGQFITLHLPHENQVLRRSYSIASRIGIDSTIDFAASYVPRGVASDYLFSLEPGQTIETSGPFGRLVLRDETIERYILVATGTGVTPYRSMLPTLAERLQQNPALKIVILQGVQKQENLLYGEDFLAFQKQFPEQVQFKAVYSRENAESLEHAHETNGYVQDQFSHLTLNPTQDVFYLCGNPNMIDTAFESLVAQGFSSAHVRREKYISSK